MPLKTAIVVFVKNEFPDFCSWMAWYFAIGVDTIVVYDDHSTDGTWEAATAASRCMDVRPRRTDLAVQPFTARQREAYLGAVKEFRDEFDWIGFFDADEFLYLQNGINLPSFLNGFPDAAAVAVSWCIYGSNGHLLKPAASTIEAFTRHSLPGFGHNRSVKSFVRPTFVVDQWRDPHTFEVGGRPYVDAQGQPVSWGGPGAIGHDPDWSTAKLMHFIPRSMEHFVERIRRRSDLQGMTNGYWNVFDKNDVEDRRPLERLPLHNQVLFRINHEIMKVFCGSLATDDATSQEHHVPRSTPLSKPIIRILHTNFDTVLAVNKTGCLVHLRHEGLEAAGCSLVYAISSVEIPDIVYLVAPRSLGPLYVSNDPRVSNVLLYRALFGMGRFSMGLRLLKTEHYISALPPDISGTGGTSADRRHLNEWERFAPVIVDDADEVPDQYPGLAAAMNVDLTAASIALLAQAGIAPMICALAIQRLSDKERLLLKKGTSAILSSWI